MKYKLVIFTDVRICSIVVKNEMGYFGDVINFFVPGKVTNQSWLRATWMLCRGILGLAGETAFIYVTFFFSLI